VDPGSAPYPDPSGAQETADGALVVLHDLPSLLAASLGEGANRAAAAALRAAGVDAATARVQVRRCDRRAGDARSLAIRAAAPRAGGRHMMLLIAHAAA
jgi:hypothetical protein